MGLVMTFMRSFFTFGEAAADHDRTSNSFQTAIHLFEAALEAADEVQMPASLWAPTHLNLGYAYRRSG